MDMLLPLSLVLFVLVLVLSISLIFSADPQGVDEEERKIVERRESKRWQQNHQVRT